MWGPLAGSLLNVHMGPLGTPDFDDPVCSSRCQQGGQVDAHGGQLGEVGPAHRIPLALNARSLICIGSLGDPRRILPSRGFLELFGQAGPCHLELVCLLVCLTHALFLGALKTSVQLEVLKLLLLGLCRSLQLQTHAALCGLVVKPLQRWGSTVAAVDDLVDSVATL